MSSIQSHFWVKLQEYNHFLVHKLIIGKLIGGCCALSGIFILTLPIPIVVNSFASFYKNRLWRNEVEHKKLEITKQLAAQKKETQKVVNIQ